MKARVDQDTCIACELCISICPKVFAFNDDGKSDVIVDVVDPSLENDCQEACDSCPVDAIIIDN